jgi:hypothetical protein
MTAAWTYARGICPDSTFLLVTTDFIALATRK